MYLIHAARLNEVDPQAWLSDVLARINDHRARDLHQLLPWNWAPNPRRARCLIQSARPDPAASAAVLTPRRNHVHPDPCSPAQRGRSAGLAQRRARPHQRSQGSRPPPAPALELGAKPRRARCLIQSAPARSRSFRGPHRPSPKATYYPWLGARTSPRTLQRPTHAPRRARSAGLEVPGQRALSRGVPELASLRDEPQQDETRPKPCLQRPVARYGLHAEASACSSRRGNT